MDIANGKVIRLDETGMTIHVPYINYNRACLRRYDTVVVGLPDGRTISPDQRRKAHALIGEIAEWVGDLPEFVKRQMKFEYVASRMQALEKKLFSLSDCDVTTAREFISYLIDFMVAHDVPSRTPLAELCEDVRQYVYACALHRKCAVCGKTKADLHHVDKIGMGNDRTKIDHVGRRAITLCREHHDEIDRIGYTEFAGKYHLEPITLTEELVKKLKLRGKSPKSA